MKLRERRAMDALKMSHVHGPKIRDGSRVLLTKPKCAVQRKLSGVILHVLFTHRFLPLRPSLRPI
jgi:hypothetical protein